MSTEILINATLEETRVAIMEGNQVQQIFTERDKERGLVGNIYKGRVVRVLPGMQAAFVDIGLEKSAFLYVGDVLDPDKRYEDILGDDGDDGGERGSDRGGRRGGRRQHRPIDSLLKVGDDIIVQVSKEPISTKGPRVTMYVSLPGRYLVYMPAVRHVGISRRISSDRERKRLREIVETLATTNGGYIVRTVSAGVLEEEFTSDMAFLELLWANILKKWSCLKAPVLLHMDLDLTFRAVRDLFTPDIDRMIIDSRSHYERVMEFVETYLPSVAERVFLYEGEAPLFEFFNVESELSRALGRRVWLKSGGYLVIDTAEALTVIDVNTGRYVGKTGSLEDTITKTNLEAVKEIAHQLRFRNIGGIIIIDFIDMDEAGNREKVFSALQQAVAQDKARINLYKMSELGLVEMSRQRKRENLQQVHCEPCRHCDGRGFTKSSTTVAYELFREVRRSAAKYPEKTLMLSVHPTVAAMIQEEERVHLEALENEVRKHLVLKKDANLHLENFAIAPERKRGRRAERGSAGQAGAAV
ncbi:MAG: Rne/Rng family ribonuclease [Nitrospirae bacterium]|nr:Rne/Rng family ribonuclease [Nitrospirota bacterium]